MWNSTGEQWMGTPAVAAYLKITLQLVYRLIDEGELPAYRFGRVYRVRREELAAFVERSRVRPGELRHLVKGRPGIDAQ